MADLVHTGDPVPDHCKQVDHQPPVQLQASGGHVLKAPGLSATSIGKLFLASRRQEYIDNFNADNLTICEAFHRFDHANDVLRLAITGGTTPLPPIGTNAQEYTSLFGPNDHIEFTVGFEIKVGDLLVITMMDLDHTGPGPGTPTDSIGNGYSLVVSDGFDEPLGIPPTQVHFWAWMWSTVAATAAPPNTVTVTIPVSSPAIRNGTIASYRNVVGTVIGTSSSKNPDSSIPPSTGAPGGGPNDMAVAFVIYNTLFSEATALSPYVNVFVNSGGGYTYANYLRPITVSTAANFVFTGGPSFFFPPWVALAAAFKGA